LRYINLADERAAFGGVSGLFFGRASTRDLGQEWLKERRAIRSGGSAAEPWTKVRYCNVSIHGEMRKKYN